MQIDKLINISNKSKQTPPLNNCLNSYIEINNKQTLVFLPLYQPILPKQCQ